MDKDYTFEMSTEPNSPFYPFPALQKLLSGSVCGGFVVGLLRLNNNALDFRCPISGHQSLKFARKRQEGIDLPPELKMPVNAKLTP